LLVVIYDLGSAGPADIANAARGLCDIVFIVDPAWPTLDQKPSELRSCGTVIEVPDSSVDRVAEVIAALEPDGIITFSEFRIPLTAAVAQRFGFRFHDRSTAESLTDKLQQRHILAAAGVDATRSRAVWTEADVAAAVADVGLPAVLKPRRGAGSRETHLVTSALECSERLQAAQVNGQEQFVLEELLHGDPTVAGSGWGDYVSVESLVIDSEVLNVCLTGKFPLVHPFRETGQFVPSTLPDYLADDVVALVEAAVHALGVRWGVTHTEVKLTTAGPRIVEVNGRLGGYVADVVRRATGYDLLRAAVRVAIGDCVEEPKLEFNQVAFRSYLPAPADPVFVTNLTGVDQLTRIPGVEYVEIRVGPGAELNPRNGTQSCFGVVYGNASDHGRLEKLMAEIGRTFTADYRIIERQADFRLGTETSERP
jgi:biotin carboxylase